MSKCDFCDGSHVNLAKYYSSNQYLVKIFSYFI